MLNRVRGESAICLTLGILRRSMKVLSSMELQDHGHMG